MKEEKRSVSLLTDEFKKFQIKNQKDDEILSSSSSSSLNENENKIIIFSNDKNENNLPSNQNEEILNFEKFYLLRIFCKSILPFYMFSKELFYVGISKMFISLIDNNLQSSLVTIFPCISQAILKFIGNYQKSYQLCDISFKVSEKIKDQPLKELIYYSYASNISF